MQRLARMHDREDRVRRDCRLGKPLQDQLQLARDRSPRRRSRTRLAGSLRRSPDRPSRGAAPAPAPRRRSARDPWTIRRTAAARPPASRRARRAGRHLDRGQHAARAVQRLQLVGNDHLDLAPRGRGIELRGTLRRGAEFGAAMHHRDRAGDVRAAPAPSPPPNRRRRRSPRACRADPRAGARNTAPRRSPRTRPSPPAAAGSARTRRRRRRRSPPWRAPRRRDRCAA